MNNNARANLQKATKKRQLQHVESMTNEVRSLSSNRFYVC